MNQKSNVTKSAFYLINIGCFFSYFLFGFMDNMKGPTLPYILSDGSFSYASGGTIIFSEYTGFFLATFFAGILADYFGQKITLIISCICLVIGTIGYAFSSSLVMFLLFIFLIGLGLGSLELSGSNIISAIHQQNKGRYLNLLNACYGVGSIITPALVGKLLSSAVSWRMVYRFSLCIIIPITLYFVLMPEVAAAKSRNQKYPVKKHISPLEMLKSVSHLRHTLMYIIIFSYVATEIGIATWMVEYLQTAKHLSPVTSSTLLSVHFIGLTVGRLLGSLFVDRFGHLRSILVFALIAALSITLGVFGDGYVCYLLALTGFGFSIIFPTATTVFTDLLPDRSGTILGTFFACGGLGGMIGPWLMGIVIDALGLQMGMMVNVGFCLIIIVSATAMIRHKI